MPRSVTATNQQPPVHGVTHIYTVPLIFPGLWPHSFLCRTPKTAKNLPASLSPRIPPKTRKDHPSHSRIATGPLHSPKRHEDSGHRILVCRSSSSREDGGRKEGGSHQVGAGGSTGKIRRLYSSTYAGGCPTFLTLTACLLYCYQGHVRRYVVVYTRWIRWLTSLSSLRL